MISALEEIHSTYWRPGQEEYEHDIQLLAAAIYLQKHLIFQASGQTAKAAAMDRKSKEAMDAFRKGKGPDPR